MGWVDLVGIVAPGLGDAFEEEHELGRSFACCNKRDHNAVIFVT